MGQENEALDALLQEFQRILRAGNVEGFRRLVAENSGLKAHLNDPLFYFDSPAIREAVDRKDLAMIDALLEAGADINQRSQWAPGGFGVLDTTGEELAEQLIARGAVVTVHAAAHLGKMDRLRALLDADPSLVNARGGDGGTPLHFAQDLAVVELLLARGADVSIRDLDHGSTAAMWQVRKRDVLYRLIQAGSPIDIYMACLHGDRDLADRALREDPDCLSAYIGHEPGKGKFAPDTGGNYYNWQIGHGARPIPVAAKCGHTDLVGYLLSRAQPIDRFIALCSIGDRAGATALLRDHPSLFAQIDDSAARALPDAIHFRKLPAAEALIDAGFSVTGHGQMGGSPLHGAAWFGDKELVEKLIVKGAPLDDRLNQIGSTPIEWACHGSLNSGQLGKDYVGIVNALIKAGAETSHLAEALQESPEPKWASPEVIAALRAALAAKS